MLRVLLVDDEPFILRGMKELIDWEDEGFEIVGSAADGEEALLFCRITMQILFFLILKCQLWMVLSCFVSCESLKKYRDIYFIILSGYADFQYAQEAIKYACNDYILKPVEKRKTCTGTSQSQRIKNIELEKERETKTGKCVSFRETYLYYSGKIGSSDD